MGEYITLPAHPNKDCNFHEGWSPVPMRIVSIAVPVMPQQCMYVEFQ